MVDGQKGTIVDAWGDKDTFSAIDEIRGSSKADKIKGSNGDDTFMGLGGKDVIDGGKGYDTLRYHQDERYDGTDGIHVDLSKGKITDGFGTIDTVKGIEAVYGTYHDDTFKGDANDNKFRGLDGIDTFDGGAGTDEVNFDWFEDRGQGGVTVNLSLSIGQIINDGFGNTENAINIEAITGTAFDDNIHLGSATGWARGGEGSDTLNAGTGENDLDGGDGDDTLIAGGSENIMTGGTGVDTFVFGAASDSPILTTTRDFLADFSQDDLDRIDISALGSLTFADNVSSTVNTDGNTIVTVDILETEADLQFLINGNVVLTEDDFIFG